MNDLWLAQRWRRLAERLRLGGAVDEAYAELVRRYGEPHRAYHNLAHIEACLHVLDEVAEQAVDRDAVELALWYHDAVCAPGDRENELNSARLAERTLVGLGGELHLVHTVVGLIMATDHSVSSIHIPPTGDAALIRDIDLVILAAPPERYDAYASAIEHEAALPRTVFAPKRAAFLRTMLARPSVFHTPLFRARHEAAARSNLRREGDALQRETDRGS